MSEAGFETKIFNELAGIKAELDEIKEHMVDADTILTEEERIRVDESFKHEKDVKFVSLSEFKKELGL